MVAHRVRADLADADSVRRSTTDAETLTDRDEWGVHYIVEGGAVATGVSRNLPTPAHPGQRMDVSVDIGSATTCSIFIDAGTFDGTNDRLNFTTDGAAIFESFDVSGDTRWRVTWDIGGTLAAA